MTQVVDMIDATGVDAGRVPAGTKRVAIYLTGGGGIAWTGADVTRLVKDDPELQTVYRIVQANSPADTFLQVRTLIVDIEPGAASLPVAIEIAKTRKAHGLRTCFYYFEAEEAGVRSAVDANGLTDYVDYWRAWWVNNRDEAIRMLDNDQRLVAVQYRSGPYLDYSVSRADWPAPLPAPTPPAPVGPKGDFEAEITFHENKSWDVNSIASEGKVVLGGPDVWDEAKVGVNRKTGHWRVLPLPLERKLSPVQIHPKVAAAASTGTALVAVRAALTAFGVHVPITDTEQAAVVAVLPAVAGWLKSSGVTVA